ncbi:hypothetical protein BV20DRAFT_149241 [Pilatotrama ljubarskyi]|nr:hypothetical protein BV20DRAFT_149241 [Pilatotrama ljubarskyi]
MHHLPRRPQICERGCHRVESTELFNNHSSSILAIVSWSIEPAPSTAPAHACAFESLQPSLSLRGVDPSSAAVRYLSAHILRTYKFFLQPLTDYISAHRTIYLFHAVLGGP